MGTRKEYMAMMKLHSLMKHHKLSNFNSNFLQEGEKTKCHYQKANHIRNMTAYQNEAGRKTK
jgi:hypothetical protein